ncbi:hypothetical protein [Haloarcula sp. JP-L23]|uniref:hypothetical protein n=1 Tax=Haloarcula sp. JP-L23 TaxID=2716717 RepID=UPI00140EAC00|nr:hypothetical protein G9465_02570 [Haloarcula sp. JP-L23]
MTINKTTGLWLLFVAGVSFFLAGIFNLPAGIGAGLIAGVLWWGLIEQPGKPTVLRGGIFGLLTVLLAHPLMWLIGGVFGHPIFSSAVFGSFDGSLDTISDLNALAGNVLFGAFLSLVAGSFTLLIGVVAGIMLVVLRRRLQSPDDILLRPQRIGSAILLGSGIAVLGYVIFVLIIIFQLGIQFADQIHADPTIVLIIIFLFTSLPGPAVAGFHQSKTIRGGIRSGIYSVFLGLAVASVVLIISTLFQHIITSGRIEITLFNQGFIGFVTSVGIISVVVLPIIGGVGGVIGVLIRRSMM